MSSSDSSLSIDQKIQAMEISSDIFRLLGLDSVWTHLLDQSVLTDEERLAAIGLGSEMQRLLATASERCSRYLNHNRRAIQNCTINVTKMPEPVVSMVRAKIRDIDGLEKNVRENAQKDITIITAKLEELKSSAHPAGDIHWACDIAIAATILCILAAAEPAAVAMGGVAYHHCN
jgi:hypothetical protein